MNRANFCHECGLMLRMRYPGDDPESGPARPQCANRDHKPLHDMLEQTRDEGFREAFEAVLEIIEAHLDAVPELPALECVVVFRLDDGSVEGVMGPFTDGAGEVLNPIPGTRHLITCLEPTPVQLQRDPAYDALRVLRKDLVQDIIGVPEEQYDNDRNELENPQEET